MQFAGHAWFTIADVLVSTIIYICKVSFKVYPETLTPIKKKGGKKPIGGADFPILWIKLKLTQEACVQIFGQEKDVQVVLFLVVAGIKLGQISPDSSRLKLGVTSWL